MTSAFWASVSGTGEGATGWTAFGGRGESVRVCWRALDAAASKGLGERLGEPASGEPAAGGVEDEGALWGGIWGTASEMPDWTGVWPSLKGLVGRGEAILAVVARR